MLNRIAAVFAPLKKNEPTSAELRASLEGIDIAAAEAEVDALESERRKILLLDNSDKQLDEIEGRIKAANRNVEKLIAGREELQASLTLAEERERLADLEATAGGAREAQGRMMVAYVELDGLAARVAELLNAIEADWRTIQGANQVVVNNQRADLKTGSPLAMLAEHLGCSIQQLPHVTTWQLHGYRPCPAERFRLGRMRELLPPSAATRKAA